MRVPRPSPRRVAVPVPLPLALAFVLAGGALPGSVAAQEAPPDATRSSRPEHRGWLVGAAVGVPGYARQPATQLFTVGVHGTHLRPGRPGVDLAVGTMPRVLAEGVFVAGARAGVALPLSLSRSVLLLPSAGASLLGGVGGGGGDGTTGLNLGVAAVVLPAGAVGVRTGVTWHRLGEVRGGVWLAEVGLVRSPRGR